VNVSGGFLKGNGDFFVCGGGVHCSVSVSPYSDDDHSYSRFPPSDENFSQDYLLSENEQEGSLPHPLMPE
jgi:hypothetical protein